MATATFIETGSNSITEIRRRAGDSRRMQQSAAITRTKARTLAATTAVHPAAIKIALGCAAWFIFISWALFSGDTETAFQLVFVTLIFAMFLGGMTWGAAMSPDVTTERKTSRSFAEFLDGDVDIATGLISGREALLQIVALPLTMAIGGTVIALVWYFVH